MKLIPAKIILENGRAFDGLAPDYQINHCAGETVFTTGMTGYVEALTDPSFRSQIVVFTYPLIGNYGVPSRKFFESPRIQAAGVVISEACLKPSHHQNTVNFLTWLKNQKIPVLTGVDTRALTKTLRVAGIMKGIITDKKSFDFATLNISPQVVKLVTCKKPETIKTGKKKIIVVDCGIKENILRDLEKFPVTIKRVPFDYDYTHEKYDGLLLSNGPGDPTECPDTISILKKSLAQNKPTFGICLGSQLLALASGAQTYKLPFGHRGHNQPCQEILTGNCYLTSQNHGYAIKADTIPAGWHATFRNLNDGSIEGYAHKSKPFFSVQFHPEAAPGPTDTKWLFDKFYDLICK